MRPSRKDRLRKAFDAAASGYDGWAPIQRLTALRLADRIAALPLPARPRILEIGCGTGLLTQALRQRLGPADWTVTDLSPAMLSACRERLGDPIDARFLVLDGEAPDLEPGTRFDLICSSLAFQWFEDLAEGVRSLAGLLAPGGWLAFATLAEDTLLEWRAAHAELGLEASTPSFPSERDLRSLAAGQGRLEVQSERLVHLHPDGRAFVEGLKGIGAGSPAPDRRPLPPGELKQVIARFEAMGAAATYHVAYGLLQRRSGAPRGVFVTGTDTGVGKTVVSACLARAWDADYWKPIQTGLCEDPGDTATVLRLAGLPPERLHAPGYAFQAPLSPDAAAAKEGAAISLDALRAPQSERPIVVEGAGGALVPLNDADLMTDLMGRLGLPVVVVARNRLGAINQVLLTLEALRDRGLDILGVILVGPAFAANRTAIERHGRTRIIAELPWHDPVGPDETAEWARLIPPFAELRR